jgi:4-amino-4-deoxy-L-arabinose transferase-like glycosyltransferase
MTMADWLQQITPSGWVAIGAVGVAVILTLQTLQGPSADYDEGVYWQSLRAMAEGHPLFGAVFSSQPPLFLLLVYPFYVIFGQSLAAARVALLVLSIAGLIGIYIAGRALGHRTIGAVACLLLALDPLYMHAAHTLQAELPSVALQIWAVTLAILSTRASGRRQRWLIVGSGVLLGCALLVKLFAIVALVPIALYLCAPVASRWRARAGELRWPTRAEIGTGAGEIAPLLGWLATGLAGAVLVLLLPFTGQLGPVYDQAVRFHLAAAQADTTSLAGNLSLVGKSLFSQPLIYAALLATVALVWRRMWVSLPIVLWALADLFTLLRQQPLLAHHAVLISPALALIAGCGACATWAALTSLGRQRLGLVVTLLVVLAAGAGLLRDWTQNASATAPIPTRTLKMAIALQGVSAPGEVIFSDDQYTAALADRDVPPQFVDTSAVRITSGYLTARQVEGYVTRSRVHVILFATGRFDLLPGFRAWVAERYTLVATFDHGGALYVLEPPTNPPV